MPQKLATRLTAVLYWHLEPEGRLIIDNFNQHTPTAPYMEAFADWWLIYRDDDDIEELASEIPATEGPRIHVHADYDPHVGYLELRRAI